MANEHNLLILVQVFGRAPKKCIFSPDSVEESMSGPVAPHPIASLRLYRPGSLRAMSLQVPNNLGLVFVRSIAQSRMAACVLGIHVGPLFDEELHDFEMIPRDSLHESRCTIFVFGIDVGSLIDEEFHEFEASRHGSGLEGRHAVLVLGTQVRGLELMLPIGSAHEDRPTVLALGIDVGSLVDEEFHAFEMSRPGSVGERGVAEFVLGLDIHVSSLVDEESYYLEMIPLGSLHESRRSVLVFGIDIGSLIKEEFHAFEMSRAGSEREGR